MKRYGPSRRRSLNASAALRIFVHHLKKTFATKSTQSGSRRLRWSCGWLLGGAGGEPDLRGALDAGFLHRRLQVRRRCKGLGLVCGLEVVRDGHVVRVVDRL